MTDPLDWWEAPVRLLAALVGGMLLGIERELKDKPAGLRTHTLVALGSAAFIVAGLQLAHEASRAGDNFRLDPMRLLEGVMGGVGFLGAGVIAFTGEKVQGLTTAANIWISAAVGTACGIGAFHIAAYTVVLGLAVLHLLLRFEVAALDKDEKDDSG